MPDSVRPAGGARRAALAAIVLAQWLGTSLWFSPSGAAEGLMARWQIHAASFGWLVAATQLGFIAGTLGFAATAAADRFSASRIFALSSTVGALANAALVAPGVGYDAAWALRFAVGLCMAGVYPLGMKMIVQWVGGKPAMALAWLVGMLTLGTAMPHGLRAGDAAWPWQAVVLGASALASVGALLVYWIGDGPAVQVANQVANRDGGGAVARGMPPASGVRCSLRIPGFRAAALGYFGHMWELYAFWATLPWLCQPVSQAWPAAHGGVAPTVALLSFLVIASGSVGCVLGGILAGRFGSARVAGVALAGSGLMCLLYPLIPASAPGLRLAALFFWGVTVVADSPQFSALSARFAPAAALGSALVAQNGIGFFISVVSILALSRAVPAWGASAMWLLAPGPIFGLWALWPLLRAPVQRNLS